MSLRLLGGWPRAVRACGHNPKVLAERLKGVLLRERRVIVRTKRQSKMRLGATVWSWLRWIDPNSLGYRIATRWHYIRMARVFGVLAYKREAPKPFLNLTEALNPGPKGPSSQQRGVMMLFFDTRVTVQPIVMRWVDQRGQSRSASVFANMRIRGQNEEGIPILELDLGRDLGELGDQSEFKERQNILEPTENKDRPSVDEWDCRYCMVPKDFEDLISPCRCRGTLWWCYHRCLKRWALMKKRLS